MIHIHQRLGSVVRNSTYITRASVEGHRNVLSEIDPASKKLHPRTGLLQHSQFWGLTTSPMMHSCKCNYSKTRREKSVNLAHGEEKKNGPDFPFISPQNPNKALIVTKGRAIRLPGV